jgi:alpha-tubulin suppressor-like RCC1 family protein
MWGWRIGTEYGKGYTLLFNPKLLQDLSFNGVVSVSANFNHTACVTKSGEVFTWGYGYYGRLGHGDYGKLGHHGQETNEESPKRVEALVGVKAKLMSCGRNHTAVCTVDGDVYTFGRSDFGQDMEIKRTRPPLY